MSTILDLRPRVRFRLSAILKNMKAESMQCWFSFRRFPRLVSLFLAIEIQVRRKWVNKREGEERERERESEQD